MDNKEYQKRVEELSTKSSQLDIQVIEFRDKLSTQEEELNILAKKVMNSKTSLALLHDEAEEISLEIKILLQKSL